MAAVGGARIVRKSDYVPGYFIKVHSYNRLSHATTTAGVANAPATTARPIAIAITTASATATTAGC